MFWRGMHNYLTNGFPIFYSDAALQRDESFMSILGGSPFNSLPMFHLTFPILNAWLRRQAYQSGNFTKIFI